MLQINGEPIIYILAGENAFKGNLSVDESLIKIKSGDTICINGTETDIENIFNIEEWHRITIYQ